MYNLQLFMAIGRYLKDNNLDALYDHVNDEKTGWRDLISTIKVAQKNSKYYVGLGYLCDIDIDIPIESIKKSLVSEGGYRVERSFTAIVLLAYKNKWDVVWILLDKIQKNNSGGADKAQLRDVLLAYCAYCCENPSEIDIGLIHDLLEKGANSDGYRGVPAIKLAIRGGNKDVLRKLLEHGCSKMRLVDCWHQTPLQIAIELLVEVDVSLNGTPLIEIVQILLENKENIGVYDKSGLSPINVAAVNERWDVVESFVQNIDKADNPDDKAHLGFTLGLYYDQLPDNCPIIGQLLAKGASMSVQNSQGYTPIEVAALDQRWDLVKDLLLHVSKESNLNDEAHLGVVLTEYCKDIQSTGLSLDADLVEHLLGMNAKVNWSFGSNGNLASQLAIKQGDPDLLHAILTSASTSDREIIQKRKMEGSQTLLHQVIESMNDWSDQQSIEQTLCNLLIKVYYDHAEISKNDREALDWGDWDLLDNKVLGSGADGGSFFQFLHGVIQIRNNQLLRTVLEELRHNFDDEASSNDQFLFKILVVLLEFRGDPTVLNQYNETPFDIAVKMNRFDVIAAMIDSMVDDDYVGKCDLEEKGNEEEKGEEDSLDGEVDAELNNALFMLGGTLLAQQRLDPSDVDKIHNILLELIDKPGVEVSLSTAITWANLHIKNIECNEENEEEKTGDSEDNFTSYGEEKSFQMIDVKDSTYKSNLYSRQQLSQIINNSDYFVHYSEGDTSNLKELLENYIATRSNGLFLNRDRRQHAVPVKKFIKDYETIYSKIFVAAMQSFLGECKLSSGQIKSDDGEQSKITDIYNGLSDQKIVNKKIINNLITALLKKITTFLDDSLSDRITFIAIKHDLCKSTVGSVSEWWDGQLKASNFCGGYAGTDINLGVEKNPDTRFSTW